MKLAIALHVVVMGALMAVLTMGTSGAVEGAVKRLEQAQAEAPAAQAPLAALADEGYCSSSLKGVLRRVLTSCGLLGAGRRGCQPGEVRNVAQIDDADFNALFRPLGRRAAIVRFARGKEDLDEASKALIERIWTDRRGASYFFIVARASTDGSTELNRALSHRRANSVYFHVADRFQDPDLERTVGLMWLGEEYAQLGTEFCDWTQAGGDEDCTEETVNRSAILSWIDCRL